MQRLFERTLSGQSRWSIEHANALEWFRAMPSQSIDLVIGSPPYERARLYLENGENLGIARSTDRWVEWMAELTVEALRVCKGLVAWVVEGTTKKFSYSASPMLLAAELVERGVTLRKPPIYQRIGIPGSGGPDWLRNDYEFVICATNGGKLPWSDNTACGHPPKWGPGGEMSHRLTDGTRVNQWGQTAGPRAAGSRRADGTFQPSIRPSHKISAIGDKKIDGGRGAKSRTKRNAHGVSDTTTRRRTGTDDREQQNATSFDAAADGTVKGAHDRLEGLVLANPGNVIRPTFTLDEVRDLLRAAGVSDEAASEIIECKVGGNLMGNPMCHENEAPFPESLPEFLIKSFCPPDGIAADCFSGSGTTVSMALRLGRRGIGCDLRKSQVELACRRVVDDLGMFA